ncbi:MAG: response regulator transcription factor [Candidatus Puniceispirillum sp.]|mgnify:CR=1 FL=1|jgi:DNA-binding response OmpR family regulator|uniref:response regulator transcription factor n=1 Tax=Candidatus Puniceispirillum sp. TaxID=2026719 RepID=UPI001ECB74AD|nr:response regulator transcription factor [Candidatus Puniceispirillum sp.]MBT6416559.1 response regulator transcription factor [Candidatus Puniceispirillum sp.]
MQDLSSENDIFENNQIRLFIVDDDDLLRATLKDQLNAEGYSQVTALAGVTELFKILPESDPDIMLLDVQMPDGNGVDVCRQLRRNGFTKPILMLTGKNAEEDIIRGLEAGANDYVAKPMRMGELLARIKSHLKQHRASDNVRFQLGSLSFVPATKMLQHDQSDQKQLLTEKEAVILKFLIRAAPEIVTKDTLLKDIWGFRDGVSTHTVETHIYRLRQKIARITSDQIIRTTGKGYCLAEGLSV